MMRNVEAKMNRRIRSLIVKNKIRRCCNLNTETHHGCSLPDRDDILVYILSRVPAESLMRCKCVSKHWKCLIEKDEYLIKLHEEHRPKCITSFLICPTWPQRPPTAKPQFPVPGKVEIRSILFSPEDLMFDEHEGGSSISNTTDVNFCRGVYHSLILDVGCHMLQPVNGLVCFVSCDGPASFLIYNPCTGEKTSWIATSTSELFVSSFGQQEVADSAEKLSLGYRTVFGFGYDPTTKQHKVLCLYSITVCKSGIRWRRETSIVVKRKLICGVFTVGENKWRKIDDHKAPLRILRNDKSICVNGFICWLHYESVQTKFEVTVFEFGSETFRMIIIPDSIPKDLWGCTRKLVNELVEVDGNLTVLAQEGDDQLNLWICNANDGNASGDWIKEAIQMPCPWVELSDLDFKAICGTDLAVVRFIRDVEPHREYVRYYNRKVKKYYKNRYESDLSHHPYVAGSRYHIIPFCETLLPVQNTQECEEFN